LDDTSIATPIDGTSVRVKAPEEPSQKVAFMSLIENIEVDPARPSAKVVVNSRTGTIVIGGDVRVTPAAVSHGSLTVRIDEDKKVTPTTTAVVNENQAVVAPGAPVVEDDTDIMIDQPDAQAFVFDPGVDLSSIVDTMNGVGATPADLVAILEALRQAGALRAELVVI
jgi:flagellar P-ring protein precursor FlgI